jgi:polar amino acid transport system substrate-binding protein
MAIVTTKQFAQVRGINGNSLLRVLTIFLFVLGTCLLYTGAGKAATLEEIKAKGSMTVATEDDYPPFEFVDNGAPKGLDHELLAILKKDSPFAIQQEIIQFQGLLAGVVSGRYDAAITAASITPERVQSLDFTMPIASGTYFYVKRKGDDSIKSIKDLSGKRLGVQQGSSLAAYLPQFEKMLKEKGAALGEVTQYASYPEAYQDLANGRLDYVLNTVVSVGSLVRDRPDVFALGEAVSPPAYHAWAVKKGNTQLLDYLNAFLKKQRDNGTLYALQEKWLGSRFEDLPFEARLPGNLPIPRN